MLTAARFKEHSVQLSNPSTTIQVRRELAAEVRDSIEIVHSQEYENFLATYLPVFRTVLFTLTRPQKFDTPEHKTRAIILEIIGRLPANETLRKRLLEIFSISIDILRKDNEDNAVAAIHIIFDLYKTFRAELSSQVQPFLDFVHQLYQSFGNTVGYLLNSSSPILVRSQSQPQSRFIPLSIQSFKVITECPLLVMFVFQLHTKFIDPNMTALCPLMVRAIEHEVSVSELHPLLKNVYQEFIASQVKTVSFLAYLLKQSPEFVKADYMPIPRSVVKLLQACPGGSVAIRKELLVATRLILGGSFRQGLFEQIDLLLDERVLVGTGRSAPDALRPLAYSFLAELVHQVRCNLTISQLNRIINMFSTNIHDPKFSYTLQTSAIRLLMNLIEGILKINSTDPSQGEAARDLLIRILETMVTKYMTLGEQVPRLLQMVEDLRTAPDPVLTGKPLSEIPLGDPLKEIVEFKTLLKTLTQSLKTVIWSAMNIRTAEASVTRSSSGVATPAGATDRTVVPHVGDVQTIGLVKGLTEKECELVSMLLPAGRKCFRLYSRQEKANGGQDYFCNGSNGNREEKAGSKTSATAFHGERASDCVYWRRYSNIFCATVQEEREIFEQFGQVFTVLDVACFQDIFGLRMSDLFDHIVHNPQAITIPQHFLANTTMSKYFADILLNFLVDNIDILDVPGTPGFEDTPKGRRASALLRLFRIMFASVNLFTSNEPVLRLHVSTILQKSLKFAAKARDPYAYLQMLRSFFKAINGGKHNALFEVLYREFCPFVEPLFQGLMALYHAPNSAMHRDLIVELCLIVPARPSTIFPYLELQMKPIVWSLKCEKETTSTGLRALEFWVDMLQPVYLNALLARVEPNIISLLQEHIHSSDTALAKYALRILGKLGPRARHYKSMTAPFSFKEQSEIAQHVLLTWTNDWFITLSVDDIVALSADVLMDRRLIDGQSPSCRHKAEAWRLLFSLLSAMFGLGSQNESEQNITNGFCLGGKLPSSSTEPLRDKARTKYSNRADDEHVLNLLVPLISTCQFSDLREELENNDSSFTAYNPLECLLDISRYFAALTVQEISSRHHEDKEKAGGSFEAYAQEEKSWRSLSPSLFVSAIVKVLSSEKEDHLKSGLKCLRVYLGAILQFSTGFVKEHNSDIEVKEAVNVSDQNRNDDVGGYKHQLENPMSGTNDMEIDGGHAHRHPHPLSQTPVDGKPVAILPNSRSLNGQSYTYHPGERIVARHVTELVEQLSHCCHRRSSDVKRAGFYGLQVIFEVLPEIYLRSQYYAITHFHAYRALMFLTRGAVDDVSCYVIAEVKKLIRQILDYCFLPGRDSSARDAVRSSTHFKEFTFRLGCELACEWACTRETVRECFEYLAQSLEISVYDILKPMKESLLRPIVQRSIRLHSLEAQVGFIQCFNFFLEKGKEKFSPDLLISPLRENLLSECIVILECVSFDILAEAEEGFRNKAHDHKFFTTKNTRLLLTLRRNIVEFLCNVAIFSNELQEQANDRLFRNVISSFFKCLQSGDDIIVQNSKVGLKQAISRHPKPKELLQHNLRPILGPLADYKKLTIQYLHSLSRVLELFSHWFNASLGDRLLEHLARWTEPEKFVIQLKGTPGTESRIGAAILDLFHLLPPAAGKFLSLIVQMVIKLESVLPVAGPGVAHLGLKNTKAASTSPYRAPLLRFCNQHANVALQFFLQNLNDDKIRQLLFVMVRTSESESLRKELMENRRRLLSNLSFSKDSSTRMSFHVISLFDLLSEHDPAWLGSDPEIMFKLKFYWRQLCTVSDMFNHTPSTLFRVEEMRTISNIFIKYCSHFQEEVDILFELLPVFLTRTVCDFTFVKDFLRDSVTREGSHSKKKLIVTRFLDSFHQSNEVSQEQKVHALQHLVIPMVSFHLRARKEFHDRNSPEHYDALNQNEIKPSQLSKNLVADGLDVKSKQNYVASADLPPSGITSKAALVNDQGTRNIPSNIRGNSSALDGATGQNNSQSGAGSERDPSSPGPVVQDEVLDSGIIQRLMKEILDQPDDVLRLYDEPLSAELLRLATELIRHMPRELGRYRKELIKFGWGHLKREESAAKHWAFVNVTTFFEAYPAPVKIILQVYVALLRAYQNDGRELVQQALDILTPALPKRLVHDKSEHRFPIWIRYTKKILLEEAHNAANLLHILQLIVRHRDLFFVARSQFVPIMAQTLTRIGLSSNSTAESRRLCVDLVGVIVNWEQRRRHESDPLSRTGNRKRSRGDNNAVEEGDGTAQSPAQELEPPNKTRKGADGQSVPTSSSSQSAAKDVDHFEPSDQIVDLIFSFLVQIPFRAVDERHQWREAPVLLRRCLDLIEEASTIWSNANVSFQFVEKNYAVEKASLTAASQKASSAQSSQTPSATESKISKPDNKTDIARIKRSAGRPPTLLTAFSLMSVLAKHQKENFVDKNVSAIRFLIKPALTESDYLSATQCLLLLSELLKLYPIQGRKSSVSEDVALSSQNNNPLTVPVGVNSSTSLPSSKFVPPPNSFAVSDSDNPISSVQDIYKHVNDSIDKNLQSLDSMRVYYGLVALQQITIARPQEFVRHQDVLVKAANSLKDRFLSSQPNSSGTAGPSLNAGSSASRGSMFNEGPGLNSAGGASSGFDHYQFQAQELSRAFKHIFKENDLKVDFDVEATKLVLSLLGQNIPTLESSQRKSFLQLVVSLIDRCPHVSTPILLEIVNVISGWVFWTPREDQKVAGLTKDPLTPKEKVNFLYKLAFFERISGTGRDEVMRSFLHLILRIFGGFDTKEKRPELVSKLERVFLLGLKSEDLGIRERFFSLFNEAIGPSLPVRINFLGKQDWEFFGDCYWIRYACEVLIASVTSERNFVSDALCARFPQLLFNSSSEGGRNEGCWRAVNDQGLRKFLFNQRSISSKLFLDSLRILLQFDVKIAHVLWVDMFPKIWTILADNDRAILEKALSYLLSREYHQLQVSRPLNNVKTILESIVLCKPLPVIRANLVQHLGSRWQAWHAALAYFEARSCELHQLMNIYPGTAEVVANAVAADAEDIKDAQLRILRMLNETDYIAAVWKQRAKTDVTRQASTFIQLGCYRESMELFEAAIKEDYTTRAMDQGPTQSVHPSREFLFWEEQWINCARNLCQWDVLTEFSRSVMNYDLLHECLWRVPEWNGMKELLTRNPIEDGPQLKLYEAYLYMHGNQLKLAEDSISKGIHRAIDKYKSLPPSADMDSKIDLLVNFQQFVELQESSSIFDELNALSGQTPQSISVDQKVDNVRLRLNTWRERLPSVHEPLLIWSNILTWRNHMHAVIVNVLENLKEAATAKLAPGQAPTNASSGIRNQNSGLNPGGQNQPASIIVQALPQQVLLMGVNETAWNVHRFARAARKQDFPEVALFAMNKLYPFGTMDLTEYFVKTKELTRSFLARPKGLEKSLENALFELSRCNMEHFNTRQKAQLFTVKAKILTELGREEEAHEALGVALNTSSDVAMTWLTWGKHCDKLQTTLLNENILSKNSMNLERKLGLENPFVSTLKAELAWREATTNCYLQAIRFGSRSARPFLCRVLRLLTIDVNSRRQAEHLFERGSNSAPDQTKSLELSHGIKSGESHETSQSGSNPPSQVQEPSNDENINKIVECSLRTGVSKVILSMKKNIPIWMLIPWLSQMVHMLARKEGAVIRPLLANVAEQFPQALFFLIRSFVEERKTIDKPPKVHFKEALKQERPLMPPIRASAALQATQYLRQMHAAKENLQRATQRFTQVRRSIETLQQRVMSPQELAKLEEEKKSAKALVDKCFQTYRAFQQRHQQLSSTAEGSSRINPQRSDKSGSEGSSFKDGWNSSQKPESGRECSQSAGTSTANSGSIQPDLPQSSGNISKTGTETTQLSAFEQADLIMTHIVKSHPTLAVELERITMELSSRLKPQREEHLLSLMYVLLRQCYRAQVKPGKKVDASLRVALCDVSRMCFRTGLEGEGNNQKLPNVMIELKKAFENELAPQVSKNFPTDMEEFIVRVRRWRNIFQRRVNAFPEHVKLEHASKYLLDVKESDVEIFGQYADADSVEPVPERHVTIDQIGSEVKVVHGLSYPCRGLILIGSDGRTYDFALETSVSGSVQAAEERMIQIYRFLNSWVFSKDALAFRKRIRLSAPTLVPTGSRTRLTSMEKNCKPVVEGLEKFLEENGKDSDEAVVIFRNFSSELMNRKRGDGGERGNDTGRTDLIASRVEAYNEVCDKHVPDTCLVSWVDSKMISWAHKFMFRKRFAETFGAACVVSHCIGVGAQRPRSITLCWSSGSVSNVSVRVLTSPSGLLESDEAVPFRLTRNIVRLLGPLGLDGPLTGSMMTTLDAMNKQAELVKMWIEFVMRDELTAWVNNKMESLRQESIRSGKATGRELINKWNREEYRLLEDRLSVSMAGMLKRMGGEDYGGDSEDGGVSTGGDGNSAGNTGNVGGGGNNANSVDMKKENCGPSLGKAADLRVDLVVKGWIDKARKAENLVRMDASWQPWY